MDQNIGALDINILLKIYDTVRYVKPAQKKCSSNSYNFEEGTSPSTCFSVWGKNAVCENCISMRALKEKKVVMKLEYNDKKVFMVIAVPMSDDDTDDRVIELIRDVTNEHLLDSKELANEETALEKINQLNRELISDPLTQLYNRRFLEERLPYELIKSWSTKSPMGLIMADIDFFKNVNDTYGHLAGDKILVDFSRLLKSMIRENHDWIIRYGGEEFLIFMSGANKEMLVKKAESIRAAVENHQFSFEDQEIKITSSFGVYTVIPEQAVDIEVTKSYIGNADKALYHSKKTGRNRVSCFGDF